MLNYSLIGFNFQWIFVIQVFFSLIILIGLLFLLNKFLLKKNDWLRLLLFVIFSLVYSFLFFRFFVKSRFLSVEIVNFEVIKIDDSLALISFITNEPHQISLIQLKDGAKNKQIDPTNTLRPQLVHDYLLDIEEQKSKILFKIDQSIYYPRYQAMELHF